MLLSFTKSEEGRNRYRFHGGNGTGGINCGNDDDGDDGDDTAGGGGVVVCMSACLKRVGI